MTSFAAGNNQRNETQLRAVAHQTFPFRTIRYFRMASRSNSGPANNRTIDRERADSRAVHDARPLIQAICLGIVLAGVLTAAAALAG